VCFVAKFLVKIPIFAVMTKKGRILALDFGLKRTGIAITDELNIIASGLKTVDSKLLMNELRKIVSEKSISTLVLGEPKRLNNEDSHITQNVYLLKEALEKQFPNLQVILYDERFTSKMAFQTMIDGGLSKKQRQNKALIDEISATILLQSYMQATSM
jgi:putative Holliday junction resolvase